MDTSAEQAAALLGCRPGGTAREVRAAYRRTLRVARPDTGGADGAWLTRVQAARDLLLSCAAPERRRRDRTAAPAVRAPAALRRSTWLADDAPRHAVDLRL